MAPGQQSVSATNLEGTRVGRFAVKTRLGIGGMGEVYLAEDTRLKRLVALKRIAPELRSEEHYRQRFIQEAERASALSHPNIAAVYDVLEQAGELYLVMEYVAGETLRQQMSSPMPVADFMHVAAQCCAALAAAHQSGIVHRDIKPENIMLTKDGTVKILDFGVAHHDELPSDDETSDTSAFAETSPERPGLSGTPAYMAPEVLLEQELDARADVFSLGVVFYEMLTARHPFRGSSFMATTSSILHDDAPPISPVRQDAAGVEPILKRMLAKPPAERYANASEVAAALEEYARAPHHSDLRAQFKRRVVLAGLAVTVVVLFIWALKTIRRPPLLTGSEWVLLADFSNVTGEPLYDHALTELVRQSLDQSPYVNIVPRGLVQEAMRRTGRPAETRVDATIGREICQRETYRALLSGQLTRVDGKLQITLQVIDPWNDEAVITETQQATAAGLYGAVDLVARRLREQLGESLAQIQKHSRPLEKVTTPSLPALQRYSLAMDAYTAGKYQEATVLAHSAVEMDSKFAMAHLCLARAYDILGNATRRREHLRQAAANVEQVSERERLVILAAVHSEGREDDQAAQQYRLLTSLYPNDIEGYRGLASVLVWLGRPLEALEAQRRAVALDPHSASERGRLVLRLNRVGRFDEALEEVKRAQTLGVSGAQLLRGAGLAHLGRDDVAAARQEFERLRQRGGTYEENLADLYLARILIYEGRLTAAAEALRAGLVLDQKLGSETWTPVRRYLLARTQLVRGLTGEAIAETRWLAASALRTPEPDLLRRAGVLAAQLGDVRLARQMLRGIEALPESKESAFVKSAYQNLKGAIEMAEGRADAAAESQRAAAVFLGSHDAYGALAVVHASRRDWPSARQALEKLLASKGEILADDFPAIWTLAHYQLAIASRGAGDRDAAARHMDTFLEQWKVADTNLAVVQRAKAERAAMQRRS